MDITLYSSYIAATRKYKAVMPLSAGLFSEHYSDYFTGEGNVKGL